MRHSDEMNKGRAGGDPFLISSRIQDIPDQQLTPFWNPRYGVRARDRFHAIAVIAKLLDQRPSNVSCPACNYHFLHSLAPDTCTYRLRQRMVGDEGFLETGVNS